MLANTTPLRFPFVVALLLYQPLAGHEKSNAQQVTSPKTTSGEVKDGVRRTPLLPPGPDNPRNSEGDFIALKDGRVLLVYTHTSRAGQVTMPKLISPDWARTLGGLR